MHVKLIMKSLFFQALAKVLKHVSLQVQGKLEKTPVMVTLLVQVQVVELLYWLTREVALEMNLVISMDVDHSLLEKTVASENMLVNVRLLMDQLILAVAVV